MPITYENLPALKRDLAPTLYEVRANSGAFISLFKDAPAAFNPRHEWSQDAIGGRAVNPTKIASGVLTLTAEDAAKLKVGTLLSLANDPAVFKVSALTATSATVILAGANGSSLTVATLPANGGKFDINATPVKVGSENGDGEEEYQISEIEWNATQIFRKEIIIPRTFQQSQTFADLENNLTRQTAFALLRINEDMNRSAIKGIRVEGKNGAVGSFGGLYAFATGDGGMTVDALETRLDSFIVNDGAAQVNDCGGTATTVLTHPDQARVLARENNSRLVVVSGTERSGTWTGEIINDSTGKIIKIVADPAMPKTHAWVVDEDCFYISTMLPFGDKDATTPGFDGQKRLIIGEVTLEFHNAKQRCSLITNLKDPATALAEIKAASTNG